MIIKTQLTKQDFINAWFALYLSKILTKLYFGLIVAFLLFSMLLHIFFNKDFLSQTFVFAFILIIRPLFLYILAKKIYALNKPISELLEYNFDEKNVKVHGESFHSTISWNKIYKVTQTKNWIFIRQHNIIASIIAKRDTRRGELVDLKEILDSHKVKNNL